MKALKISQSINVAVDAIIFTIIEKCLHILLIQMKTKPFEKKWATPGGLIEQNETTKDATLRILKIQTGVKDVYLEQLKTFDSIKRDPNGRVISIAYFALVSNKTIKLHTTDKYFDIKWFDVDKLPALAYDHDKIVREAIERLKAKIQYTNIVFGLLPDEFTLGELQSIYETILNKRLDKRNFRKRIKELDLIIPTGNVQQGKAYRPAVLYKFKHHKLEYVDISS